MPAKSVEAARASRLKWYYKNKDKAIKKNQERREKLREWLTELKSTLQCKECGENRIPCLDFHHRNPKEKEISIPFAIHSGWAIKKIQEEIDKCDILCANCHRWYHHNERIQARGIPGVPQAPTLMKAGSIPAALA
jgi:hypothetical protein